MGPPVKSYLFVISIGVRAPAPHVSKPVTCKPVTLPAGAGPWRSCVEDAMPGTSDQWSALDRQFERLVEAPGPDILTTPEAAAQQEPDPGGRRPAGTG